MSEQNRDKHFLTARQLAEVLQISLSTIHRLRRQGRIPAVMVTPRIIRFNLRDVRSALAEQPIPDKPNEEPVIKIKQKGHQLAFEDLFTETFD
jgi:excisionase family DNA binding protein